VSQLISTVERLAAKAVGDRIITVDRVYHEMDAEQKSMFAPGNTQCFLRLREGETLMDYICRGVLAVYAMERANLGRHTAAAHRLGGCIATRSTFFRKTPMSIKPVKTPRRDTLP
jgi:hypothetical protein